ncbi:unnamed protein product, partial [Urochloa humidicola]
TTTPLARGTPDLEALAVAMEPEGAVILKPPVTMIKGLYVELGMEIPEQVFRNLLKTQAIGFYQDLRKEISDQVLHLHRLLGY